MIKKFNQFVNESHVPGPTELGSARILLSDEEADWFSTEPALQKLISDNRVSLLTPELWYIADDRNTINILEDFFPNHPFEMQDEEDYEEEESEGFDEENESIKSLSQFINETSFVKNYDEKSKEWVVLYANETKSKEFKKEEDADDFIKDLKKEISKDPGKPESYRDKMKRKVSDAKKSAESGKRNYTP